MTGFIAENVGYPVLFGLRFCLTLVSSRYSLDKHFWVRFGRLYQSCWPTCMQISIWDRLWVCNLHDIGGPKDAKSQGIWVFGRLRREWNLPIAKGKIKYRSHLGIENLLTPVSIPWRFLFPVLEWTLQINFVGNVSCTLIYNGIDRGTSSRCVLVWLDYIFTFYGLAWSWGMTLDSRSLSFLVMRK